MSQRKDYEYSGEIGPLLKILYSFPEPKLNTNPYVTQLIRSISLEVEPVYFSWKTALFAKYDVFHVHWPEWLLRGRSRSSNIYKPILFLLLLVKLRLGGVPVVRTLHNLKPHESLGLVGRQVHRLLDQQVSITINLNDIESGRGNEVTILHGHYKDWYPEYSLSGATPAYNLLFVGMIRPYKGIEALIDAVVSSGISDLSLLIAGVPANKAYASDLVVRAGNDTRIKFEFGYLEDSDFSDRMSQSDLVVLPYPSMFNSGAMIAALSLGRSVLVPDTAVTRKMVDEIGSEWVLTFDGALTSQSLEAAYERVLTRTIASGPNLSGRDWKTAGRQHIAVYKVAMERTK